MTLIRDLIDIPERVHADDFVLRLSEGVDRPEETLRQYVVTTDIAKRFDQALGLVQSAIKENKSKGAYLHGSFGSGKSHFMAVLLLLLRHHPGARSIKELSTVVADHSWTEGRKFLLVPYHMIGAASMESAILGHYAEHVRRLHPDAPIPAVFQSEKLFADATGLRSKMGDVAFFGALNASVSSGAGWGRLKATWDAARFEAAVSADPGADDRRNLVSILVATFFRAYEDVAQASGEGFVDLEDGLSIIAAHAKGLGYDALILFLDELILWLASRAADAAFVSREGPKLVKLVEYHNTSRPIPIVSFIARQRDLKELVGEFFTGAEQLRFADVLNYWEARFSTIKLEDRDLPQIASKRLLAPASDEAALLIDAAFERTTRVRTQVMDTLLAGDGDRAMFRQVYPFSPALVQTLIAVSSALQRERTALKVMLLLLVQSRDWLTLDEVLPVGDLFDVIAEGDEPFMDVMRKRFDDAKKLYFQKLLPLLEREHGLGLADVRARPREDPRVRGFRADDRILKTLLLGALVPEVAALKALTAPRLAALNHGSIKSPIPGQEGSLVLTKCRKWAAEVGEIRIGADEPDPTISLQITGIDTESILAKARGEDNPGNQRQKIKEILLEQFGLVSSGDMLEEHEFTWRGTKRTCELLFGNVREMISDEPLTPAGDGWRFVVDHPFDEPAHTPNDDRTRVEQFIDQGEVVSTVVWLPNFLSTSAKRDLGVLVMLDEILKDLRFPEFVGHLPPVDRSQARVLLENQRSQLRQRLVHYLEAAYGIRTAEPGWIDPRYELSEHLYALNAFQPKRPVGATLKQAFQHLLDQTLSHEFPMHPEFGTAVTKSNLKKVLDEAVRAVRAEEIRIAIDSPTRPLMRQIAVPLRLGEMGETHFVKGEYWKTHFSRKHAQEPGAPMTVGRLRAWIDEPQPLGLPKDVQNLLILVFAAQTDRALFRSNLPVTGTVDQLPDDIELRLGVLPDPGDWVVAVQRASSIFGAAPSPLLNGQNVAKLASDVREEAAKYRDATRRLRSQLDIAGNRLGQPADRTTRGSTAAAAAALLDRVTSAEGQHVVTALAKASVPSTEAALGTSLKKAADVVAAIENTQWGILDAACELPDDRAGEGRAIKAALADAFANDELASSLPQALKEAQARAVVLIRRPPPPTVAPPPPGRTRVAGGQRADVGASDAAPLLQQIESEIAGHPDRRLTISWQIDRVENDPSTLPEEDR